MVKTLYFVLFILLVQHSRGQGYCTRAAGIFNTTDGGAACLDSISFNVINCCFRCTTNSSNLTKCGSLYNYAIFSCSENNTILEQAKADCIGPGNSGNFQCFCNTGTNRTEVDATNQPTIAVNTASPTMSPTGAPTNAAVLNLGTGLATLFFIVLVYTLI